MTVTLQFPSRGAENPDTRATNGREANFQALADEINGIVANNIQAENIFGVNSQSSAVNITLTALESHQIITMTAADRTVTLPQANATASNLVYDGAKVIFHNAGSEDFDINANGGTKVTTLLAKQKVMLVCESDTSAPGTWEVIDLAVPATFNFFESLNSLNY